MQLGKQVRRIQPDRQARLRAYLALYGIAVSGGAAHGADQVHGLEDPGGRQRAEPSRGAAGGAGHSAPAPPGEDKKRGPKPRGDQAA